MFKSQQQLIEEIHNEFDSAQERLLSEAKQILSSKFVDDVSLEEKQAERLKRIGFTSVPLVKKAEVISKEKEKTKKLLVETEEQARLIEYYKQSYPFLKFLTEAELDRICDKYNLIHAPIANFIGDVPDKNLRDIENVQELKEYDRIVSRVIAEYEVYNWWGDRYKNIYVHNEEARGWDKKIELSQESEIELERELKKKYNNSKSIIFQKVLFTKIDRSGLFIAAPSKDFDLTGLDKKSKYGFFNVFKIEVKDPIVFRYVRGGIQVLTKWGLEANDPSLVLPINN